MHEESFPGAKFELMHNIDNEHVENVEVMILERMGKSILAYKLDHKHTGY